VLEATIYYLIKQNYRVSVMFLKLGMHVKKEGEIAKRVNSPNNHKVLNEIMQG
jgi:hypothetical protein